MRTDDMKTSALKTSPLRSAFRTFASAALLPLVLGGCSDSGGAPDSHTLASWKTELMEADVAFNLAVANEGAAGWVSFFSSDGAMISQGAGELRGHAAIQGAMEEAFSDPTYRLTWEPLRAEISRAGDLGYTVGRYTSSRVGSLGQTIRSSGMYVSIWRRQADGSWKVEMDLGTPTAS